MSRCAGKYSFLAEKNHMQMDMGFPGSWLNFHDLSCPDTLERPAFVDPVWTTAAESCNRMKPHCYSHLSHHLDVVMERG